MPHTPLTMDDMKAIGRITKAFGYEGDYIVSSDYDEAIANLDFVFIEVDGLPVPLAVARAIRQRGGLWRTHFSPVIEDESLVGHALYAKTDDLRHALHHDDSEDGDDEIFLEDLVGYNIVDTATDTVLGVIADIDDSTANTLFIVKKAGDDGNTILVPAADDLVEYIEDGTIGVCLPQGLLDL